MYQIIRVARIFSRSLHVKFYIVPYLLFIYFKTNLQNEIICWKRETLRVALLLSWYTSTLVDETL